MNTRDVRPAKVCPASEDRMYITRRRARCEAAADAVAIPRPFDLDALCEGIAAQRGRPLRLVALEGAPDSSMPCGVLVATESADLIFYEPATSALHKLQIVLHELAHLLLDHGGPDSERPAYATRLLPGAKDGQDDGGAEEDEDEDLGIDLDQVLHILGRTSYSDNEEKDAELLATILSHRILDREATTNPVLERLGDALGHPIRTSSETPRDHRS
ncbi:hypothetical protein [Streptomyces ureilyticus]|uniref:IrrE N-terminal-like domain-containing protein n=1 Tax=Streptomyces ureilyticus TaxID=1775131 RepID=A0ABX0E4F8_9ACTN|nr:hypothetical protein [Streptomyces ureilyticus]NGO47739.1 hypothetical protein [Streptomyces ureilyticus]